ncbi:DNA-directed RNA polymerase subunit alpha [Texas Phoenix palm phytoplasma]|uniref:DNA-directed RNA polymerase subunit alpha n=1 Tax=Texas Phoenix palm phytoplasma TaxID=176709 RepID=A0ABS5BIH7_9MOLU|nr:DNA-directed RNA polymerase subunit alpha [Texas Phoenix palm phytoplasma]MBP3059393.1 DNA-directed RNA polymerase subunit alpha [Texas Phoenix palm phytoplasma]
MEKLKFIKPVMTVDEADGNDLFNKTFIVKRLERGFGVTLGNSLRRVLLSSLPGAAIVNVYIEGVEHEFSVIPGVYEDVMSIVLNLKKVILAVDSSEEDFEQKLEIDVVGERVVTAADFKLVDGVKIINKEQHIARISGETTRFKMEVSVRKGMGYVSSEGNKIYNQNRFGVIPIDSIYTPISSFSFNVEQKLNNKEELTMNITTNKSITSKEALATASKILIDHLNVLLELCEKVQENNFIYEPKIESHNHVLDLKIDQLEVSVRLFNSLKNSGINTVKELVNYREKDIMKLNSLGKKSFEELKQKMDKLEISFKKE